MTSKPCVGCGWCCISDQCEYSLRKYGYMRRCPALLWENAQTRYVCLLMSDPVEGEAARRELFTGQGCCAPLVRWRDNVRNRDKE